MVKLFRFLRPFKTMVIYVLILKFFETLSLLFLPTLMSDIIDIGIVNGDTNYIFKIGGLMLIVAAGSVVCTVIASYFSSKTAMGFGKNLRGEVFSRVEQFSLQEIDQIGTASLITRTTNDITQMQQVLMVMLRMMVIAPIMCIGGIIMAISKDAQLSLVMVFVVPILAVAIFIVAKKGIPLFKAMQSKLDHLNLVLRENLTGIRVIRAFNRINFEKKRFHEANLDLTNTAIKVNKILAALMPVLLLAMNFTTIGIIWFGGIRIDQGSMQVGDLMAFVQYIMLIMFSLVMVSMMFVMIPRASASAVRINEILDTVPNINDDLQFASGESIEEFNGLVEFKNVTFSYPGAERAAINDISFRTNPGEVTAIIGGTGSGKSTLVNLILRFYDVDSGSIIVNGQDIRQMTQKSLRAKIGLVPQKAVLFTGTITDNIKYGKKDATEEEVIAAAKTAQATEFISELEKGFATIIAQGGTNLSGGQKQRLSIARALVKKPEIYIFDDSFSALDFKTDAKLRTALKSETKHATVIIVAQRVTTVLDADQIIVLDKGQISGIGKHRELLKTCGVYREIVSSQLSEEELA